jgi:putative transposase
MSISYPVHWPQFYTATCNEWLPLLDNEKYKNIIVDSLRFLVRDKRLELNAFVIMNNHLHLIWQAQPRYDPPQLQLSFMKYTAQQIKFELQKDNPALLEKCKVNKADRKYQVWKRDSLGIELFTEAVFNQKID